MWFPKSLDDYVAIKDTMLLDRLDFSHNILAQVCNILYGVFIAQGSDTEPLSRPCDNLFSPNVTKRVTRQLRSVTTFI